MLLYWEANREVPEMLFGQNRALQFVSEVRNFLRSHNMMSERPPNWIDPLGEQQYEAMKLSNMKKHKQMVLDLTQGAIDRQMERVR
jgi:hypothetical protein